MITLANALKATRRGIYQHGADWRTLVAVEHNRQVPVLFDECEWLMDASSMAIENARYATRTIQMDKGGMVHIAAIGDLTDAYLLAGRTFAHVIWLYQPSPKVEEYVGAFVRSHVPGLQTRIDFAEW